MKSTLLAGAAGIAVTLGLAGGALAADLPVSVPVVDLPAPVSPIWTGFYVGGQVGYAFGGDVWATDPFIDTDGDGVADSTYTITTDDADGFEAGIYLGADVQFDAFVLGVIADVNYIDLQSDILVVDDAGPSDAFAATAGLDWYTTLRARAGFAFDQFMPYVHGGLAYTNVDIDGTYDDGTAIVAVSDDDDLFGYAVGAGVEALFMENVSVKAEYQYTDLGETSFEQLFTDGSSSDVEVDFHSVRLGAAIRF